MTGLRPFREWSLGVKLAGTLFVVVAGVTALVSASLMSQTRAALEGELAKRGQGLADNLARLSRDLVLQDDLWGLYKVVRDIADGSGDAENVVVDAVVLDQAGWVLAHSDPARHPMGEPFRESPEASRDGAVHHLAVPVVVDNQPIGTARVGITTRYLDATVAATARRAVIVGAILGALGVLLGLTISRRMTRPLRELAAAVDRLGEGRLEEPVLVRVTERDEIGRLADRFTLMALRLRDHVREREETQRHLESLLVRRQELEARLIKTERLASVGELAGALAHEIRNPLGAVVAAARMLAADSPQAAGYDQAALIRVITDESRRLDRILADFLAFARPRRPLRQAHSLNRLVGEILDSLRLDPRVDGTTLRSALDPALPPLAVDADQIKQVVWNVVRNALDATGAAGEVCVSTAVDDGHLVVDVVDAGAGIPPEQQARLFEPFHTTKPGGSGLGLAVAHRIVAAHGGSIEVASRAGAGTRVRILLPRTTG